MTGLFVEKCVCRKALKKKKEKKKGTIATMCPSLAQGLHIGSPQQCELLPSQQTCSVLHVRLHFPHLNNVTHKTVE